MQDEGLTVTVDLPPLMTCGSPALLARLVGNVIDNAVSHNENGGWIRISGTVREDETVLVVDTGGRVLDQREVDRLMLPFERLGDVRTGTAGLGLSIVASVAAAHGGRLSLVARPEGGLSVSIALPVPS